MIQVISVVGAALILAAYAANQLGRIQAGSFSYSVVNAVGAAMLTFVAATESQRGFLLLEGVWTLVSLYVIWRLVAPGPFHARG
jgi:hypothetical protein